MTPASDAPQNVYTVAWIAQATVLLYYVVAAVVLRWGPRRGVGVTQYEPPEGISPAVTAFLLDNGRCERAFAAAIVSLAAKGYLKIQQQGDFFVLEKRRGPDGELQPEESLLLERLFPGSLDTYSFNGVEYSRVRSAFDAFEEAVKSIADPELISAHFGGWIVGMSYSLAWIIPVIASHPVWENSISLGSLLVIGIGILLGGSCFVSALWTWPVTLRKLWSFLPWDNRPSRPLTPNDAIPLILTGGALVGFGLLASETTTKLAGLLTAVVFMNAVFRHALAAPTQAGRKALAQLADFREFLARTDADRLNRENMPGQTPQTLEKYSAYALALRVEHAWGEEFAENLLELLQIDLAYRRRTPDFMQRQEPFTEIKLGKRR
jgi:hypothetical protein